MFVLEACSVILQVALFYGAAPVFSMSPLHHHFR